MLVNKYYIIFNTDKMDKKVYYKELIIYDLNKNKVSYLELPENLSIDTYINGIFDHKLYITDVDSEIQYCINPKKKKIEKVGNREDGFYTVHNEKLVSGELENNIFEKFAINANILKLYKTEEIFKDLEYYYFKTEGGDVYQVINHNYKHPIKLFSFDNIKELKIGNGYIHFVVDDTIYVYNDEVGLKPVIRDNELKYNYKNIYDVWKK